MIESPKWDIENASVHPANLSENLQGFKLAGDALRSTMENISVKKACDMTDIAVLRNASRRV